MSSEACMCCFSSKGLYTPRLCHPPHPPPRPPVPPPKQALCPVFFHSSGAMWSRSLGCSCVCTQLDSPPDLLFLLGEWLGTRLRITVGNFHETAISTLLGFNVPRLGSISLKSCKGYSLLAQHYFGVECTCVVCASGHMTRSITILFPLFIEYQQLVVKLGSIRREMS